MIEINGTIYTARKAAIHITNQPHPEDMEIIADSRQAAEDLAMEIGEVFGDFDSELEDDNLMDIWWWDENTAEDTQEGRIKVSW